ncbi:GTP-binding protein [Scytonema sp. UIC 10036]|uniref:GTP-binding protein n=1 Tax=Scytonema sp. UIC 10036 TaxID=2304196 RepID=UPI0012DA8B67|nr:GTP-binding protein [Scytonema sp. UIC 10036]MUG94527.1 GTP-binding protein [Scytonema sp. UIC 10036]
MTTPRITVVAGPAGVGKTTWIYQHIATPDANDRVSEEVLYLCLGSGNIPIDQTYLKAELPHIKVFGDDRQVDFFNQLPKADAVYIELGSYLQLGVVAQVLDNLPYWKVALLPPQLTPKYSDWYSWAEAILPGAAIDTNTDTTHLWRVLTTGEVIDEDSLHEFWYEITHGAYGKVARAKGIFEVADGRSLYADFVSGVPSTEFLEFNLPRYLEGRPKRFSGIEVLGQNLDEAAMHQTLEDCCLSEVAIRQYQQQVKQILLEEIQA